MGRSGITGEIQQELITFVTTILMLADSKTDDVEKPLPSIKVDWSPQPDGQSWLRVEATDQDLCLLPARLSGQAERKADPKERHDLKYLIKLLERIDILEFVRDGSHNRPRVPGTCFYLKLRSKQRSANLEQLRELLDTHNSPASANLASNNQSALEADPDSNNQREPEVEELVKQVRSLLSEKIQQKYGNLRVFGTNKSVKILDIYTSTDIWQEIIDQRWQPQFELLQSSLSSEGLDRYGLENYEPPRHCGQDVAEKCQRLMVLGKPGIGKTTYLKYLAMQCIKGEFRPEQVPIFVQLSYFGKVAQQDPITDKLFNFICSTLIDWKIPEESVRTILKEGKALILLDGLDEVPSAENELVKTQTIQFINRYSDNSFLITCRVAANIYRFSHEDFSEIEIADFTRKQTKSFIESWFQVLLKNQSDLELNLGEELIAVLNQPEYRTIQELAITPLLLNLICIVFRDTRSLPKTRYQLYEKGINVLLQEWDVYRNLYRDQIHPNLSNQNKIDLLLHLARTTFEQSNYIFEEQLAQSIVLQYLQRFSFAPFRVGELDSRAIIRAIAAHHGLLAERAVGMFSFSHLTFHEYFTARSIHQEQAWPVLLSQLCNSQWREVFLLVIEMQSSADDLIQMMGQQIKNVFSTQIELQRLLVWIDRRATKSAEKVSYKLSALRAWYFSLNECNVDEGVESFRQSGEAGEVSQALLLARTMGLDKILVKDLLDCNLLYDRLCMALSLIYTEKLVGDLVRTLTRFYYTQLLIDKILPALLSIKQLLFQLDNLIFLNQQKMFINWWHQDGEAWASRLLEELQPSDPDQQQELSYLLQPEIVLRKDVLKQYYEANLLLIDCMKRAQFVTPSVQSAIENALLIPS